MDRLGSWPLRVLWAALPLTAGPLLGAVLDPTADAFRTAVTIALWGSWASTMLAVLVPRALTLTAVRIVVPAAPVAATWAALVADDASSPTIVLALVGTALPAVAALSAVTADAFVDGSSYGDERRLTLRTPGPLLLGPVELTWAAIVVGATAGPLLLAAGQWVAGAAAVAVGVPVAVLATRALHGLSRRWVVFVPAGFVLHDLAAVEDPILLPRRLVTRLGPALADTDALDLTVGALGLALQADLAEPVTVLPAARRGSAVEPVDTTRVLFTPARPGALLAEAARRRVTVG